MKRTNYLLTERVEHVASKHECTHVTRTGDVMSAGSAHVELVDFERGRSVVRRRPGGR